MFRRTAAIVVALTINPASLYAQDVVLMVTVPSADVYKAPTNVTPVIGHVSQGTVLPIERNLGSWVKIPWPGGQDGFGFVHVSNGRIGPLKAEARAAASASPVPPRTAATVVPITQTPRSPAPQPAPRPVSNRPSPRVQGNTSPASHVLGVGGVVGYARAMGVTARAWSGNHFGIQFALTRNTLTNNLTSDQITTTQFEPGVMYGLFDRITDYVWLRPYVGSTLTVRRVSTSALQPVSESTTGFRAFGGAELMFASAPQFGLSADVGYRRFSTEIPGFEPRRMSVSVAGHWYIR